MQNRNSCGKLLPAELKQRTGGITRAHELLFVHLVGSLNGRQLRGFQPWHQSAGVIRVLFCVRTFIFISSPSGVQYPAAGCWFKSQSLLGCFTPPPSQTSSSCIHHTYRCTARAIAAPACLLSPLHLSCENMTMTAMTVCLRPDEPVAPLHTLILNILGPVGSFSVRLQYKRAQSSSGCVCLH